ncbi:MAG: acetate--CoA ligase family protein [Pseudomonadota bacterium]
MSGARPTHPLHGFFEPSTVAILGASSDPNKLGGRPARFMREAGYAGVVYPVNSRATEIQGYRAFASVRDIPGTIDQALIILPAPACRSALEECADKGIPFVQIFSAGFGELGAEGLKQQQQLVAYAREHGIRLLGPNCLGLVGVRNGFFATFSSALEALFPTAGGIAIATQSGAFGSCAYAIAIQRGLGLSRMVSTGNEADVDVAECIDYLADDPETRVICAAIEGCRNGERLRSALAKAAERRKPVVMMKLGATAIGIAGAATHTGTLAGNDAVYDAVFAECGAWRAHSIEEMLDVAYFCDRLPVPTNARAGAVTISGGIGILMADDAEPRGLVFPEMPEAAARQIAGIVPFATIANPMDTTAQVSAVKDGLTSVMEVVLKETDWATLFLFMAQLACAPERFEPMRLELRRLRQTYRDRCLVLIGPSDEGVRRALEADGFVVMDDPTRSVAAAAAASSMYTRRQALHVPVRPAAAPTKLGAIRNEADAKRLLGRYGIPVSQERVCTSKEEAVGAARALGLPVAAKILSADIAHKTEIGGVMLGLYDAAAVAAAFEELTARARAAAPQARIDGVLISPMAGDGVETILGIHMDPVFGPMILFGLGGVAVELFKDVAFASAPLSRERALSLVRSVRASRLLQGWRKQPPYDVAALVDALIKLSQLAAEHADALEGIDINPFLVGREGAVCLDALVSLRDTATAPSSR